MAQARLLPARFLDPRPASESHRAPLEASAALPAADLADRAYELPPPGEAIRVLNLAGADEAVSTLDRMGRRAERETQIPPLAPPNHRYRLWRPNPFLHEVASEVRPGRALDLGCGTGRDAVALAAEGWRVVGVDRLPDAIECARTLAQRYLPEGGPAWHVADLERESLPEGPYELVCLLFFIRRPLLARLPDLLAPGGIVVIEAFTPTHRDRTGRPRSREHTLSQQEAAELLPGLEIRRADEGDHEGRHTLRLVASSCPRTD
jgi:tellurite methyltransferase